MCDFEGFDLNGNVLLRETDQGKVSFSIRRPLTGAVVKKYLLPADKPKIKLIEQWSMYADIVRTADVTYTIGIYDITDGRMMVLTDDESATAYSKKYQAEVAANNAAMEAAARSNQESWDRHMREYNQAQRVELRAVYQQKTTAEQERSTASSSYEKCPDCNGTGNVLQRNIDYNKTTTTYSSGAGSGSVNYKVSSTPVYNNYAQRTVCSRCNGSGLLRKR